MKKALLFLFVILSVWGCQEDISVQEILADKERLATRSTVMEDYYYGSEGRIPIHKSSKQSYVLFKGDVTDLTKSTRGSETITINNFQKYDLVRGTNTKGVNFNSLSTGIVGIDDIAALNESDNVIYTSPYYSFNKGGKEYPLTNVFYVGLKDIVDITQLQKLATEHNVVVAGQFPSGISSYILYCTKESSGNALEMANLFYETGLFKSSYPEFLAIEWNCAFPVRYPSVNDPFFKGQDNLCSAAEDGTKLSYDINFCDARAITSGASDITVAVVDSGVAADHPDLNVSYVHDAATQTDIATFYTKHGTNCAGIINAQANNGEGIAGIAPNCKLMSISAQGSVPQAEYAIRYAADNGADVISCSWNYSTDVPDVNDAIEYAISDGRDYKGCVVVFAAGNIENFADGTGVGYPAKMISDIIVVGSSYGDRRYSVSRYGKELDILAPGVNISTTSPDDYTSFTGTSAAAPHVAGIAALILSIRPDLSQKQVATAIEESAFQSDRYTYGRRPRNTNLRDKLWNEEVGYGLVNALKALESIMPDTPPARTTQSFVLEQESEVTIHHFNSGYKHTSFEVLSHLDCLITEVSDSYNLLDQTDYNYVPHDRIMPQAGIKLILPSGTYTVNSTWYGYPNSNKTVVVETAPLPQEELIPAPLSGTEGYYYSVDLGIHSEQFRIKDVRNTLPYYDSNMAYYSFTITEPMDVSMYIDGEVVHGDSSIAFMKTMYI